MFWFWFSIATTLLTLLSLFWPLQLTIQFRQHAWQATVWVQMKYGLIKLGGGFNISEQVRKALEHVIVRWNQTGEPVKVPLQKTVRRLPRKKLLWVVIRPLRYLGRRTRCSHLRIRAEVGGSDAMESALLAGVSWSVVGGALGIFSSLVRFGTLRPAIEIIPHFQEPAWRVQADCILRLRLGHAIVAGVWLLRRVWREKEIVAWARDSWRRKGVEGSGRTSDSGSDEDSDGEPERHG